MAKDGWPNHPQSANQAVQRLHVTDDEMTARTQTADDSVQDQLLGRLIEIDEHIAQQHEIELPLITESLLEIMHLELHPFAQPWIDE